MQRFASNYFHALYSTPADMLLIKAALNTAAQLPRGIVLSAGNRAKLQPQRHANRPKRFDSEYARAVHQNRRPRGIRSEFPRHLFQRRERRVRRAARRQGDIHKELAPIPAKIRDLGNLAIGDADQGALNIADHRAAECEVFDSADDSADSHCFAHDELVFHDREESVDQIAHEVLRPKTERQARESCDSGNGCDIESELG